MIANAQTRLCERPTRIPHPIPVWNPGGDLLGAIRAAGVADLSGEPVYVLLDHQCPDGSHTWFGFLVSEFTMFPGQHGLMLDIPLETLEVLPGVDPTRLPRFEEGPRPASSVALEFLRSQLPLSAGRTLLDTGSSRTSWSRRTC